MFGRNKTTNEIEPKHEEDKEHAEKIFDAEYMGGHVAYPNKSDCLVGFYQTQIALMWGTLRKHRVFIPYNKITNVENEDENRITKTRVLLTGFVVGLLW